MTPQDRQAVHAEWEGRLDADERAALDARAAHDPALAAYRSEMRLLRGDLRALGDSLGALAPPSLDLDAIAARRPPPLPRATSPGLPAPSHWLAAAAAVVLMAGAGLWWARREAPAPQVVETTAAAPEGVPVEFRMPAPAARTVAVAGDFNNWQPEALAMKANAAGIWVAKAELPRGRYSYMYVVDGNWVTPPDAQQTQDDGFGARNAVLDIL
ncbi:MAG: isoamylase early set domain-containing protein [Myxococcales bacterium]|nr:isoamylase early set domain-containing protein [Myxococcales bacterium]